MGKDRLNVLSIDWDYFIDASIETRSTDFPDGNDNLNTVLQGVVWSSRYAFGDLSNVKIDYPSVGRMRKFIESLDCWYSCMVVDSHKYAYNFVLDNYDKSRYDGISLVNIDFHHDIYNNGDGVDCGNWLRKLMENSMFTGNSEFIWVAREDSDADIDLNINGSKLNKVTDLDIIKHFDWDIIFICRSGMWSPPHLDKYFKKTFKSIMNSGSEVAYEKGIFNTRFTSDFQSSIIATVGSLRG